MTSKCDKAGDTIVSVIIVAFNQRKLLAETLRSLSTQTFRDFETIVVDNGSTDGTEESVRAAFPSVIYIKSDRNLGFAGGNNLGLAHARGEHIALLNSDASPRPDWLRELVAAMDSHPDAGICASKMLVAGTDRLDSAGDGFSTNLKGFKRGEGMASSAFDKPEYVFGACAGAALYRRKMLDEIGFLDEDFFLIYEDADLNLRAQLAGWKAYYVPSAVVDHKVRSTIGRMSDTAVYYSIRNSDLVRIKDIPLGLFIRCFPAYITASFLELLFFAVRHGRLGLYLKAQIDAMRLIPKMLKKRSHILPARKVGNSYLRGIMTPLMDRDFFRAKAGKFLRG